VREVTAVWAQDCLAHEPKGEVWVGVHTPGRLSPADTGSLTVAVLLGLTGGGGSG